MTSDSGTPVDPGRQARLEQYLRWAIPADFGFAVLQVAASLLFRDSATGLTAAVMFGYGVLLLAARRATRAGRLQPAIALICYGLFGADVILVLVQPALLPSLALVPMLGVSVALPYVSGRVLRRFIGLAGLTSVVVVLCGTFLPHRPQLPPLVMSVFSGISLLLVIALILLLLWQFSSRLTDTLARTQAAEERYSRAARGANDGLWDWDLATGRIYYSARWKAMLGYDETAVGERPEEWLGRVHPDERARVQAELDVHCDGLTPQFESEHRLRDANGRYRWVLARGVAVVEPGGRATRLAGSLTDISVRKSVEAQLLHDAMHDALTGLPNRALFMQQLERAVRRARREPGYGYAVLYLDLDRFKVVNDSLGHAAGDDLLRELGRRLPRVAGPEATVARLGGDEFAVLLGGAAGVPEAMAVAQQVQAAVQVPYFLDAHPVAPATSIGIATSDPSYELPEQVLRDADTALYRAKAQGRGRHVLFTRAMHADALELLRVEVELRRAIEQEELTVYYQPIVALQSGQVSGFEALVRWHHPQRGLVEPAAFLDVAEETGLIAALGWFVLEEACRQQRLWAERFAPLSLTMSVNLSASQLAHANLSEQLNRLVSLDGRAVPRLCLEITEAVMVDPMLSTRQRVETLRAQGVEFYIDDFGTGYSSLSLVHELPVSGLKIDRSFIRRLGQGPEPEDMIAAILDFAQRLGLSVIAEGIERADQVEVLVARGCRYGQGHFFSPAVCAEEAEALLTRPVVAA